MPIVPIKIKQGDTRASYKSILSYGPSRSGKTRFAATFPRPRFLSDASERGWTTIETMPSECFYEPDRPPEVWPVNNAQEMTEALNDCENDVWAGKIHTIVVDSLTFYGDVYFQWLLAQAVRSTPQGKAIDNRALYGALAQHLATLRTRIHQWPCNVIWLALERTPDADHPRGGPLLTGQTAQKFPAGCDHVFLHRSYTMKVNEDADGKPCAPYDHKVFEMHTGPYGNYLVGGRDSGLLPSPIIDPDYRQFAQFLELPDPLKAPRPKRPTPAQTTAPAAATPTTASPAAPQAAPTTAARRVVTATSTPARRS